jgi:hypothetical protein
MLVIEVRSRVVGAGSGDGLGSIFFNSGSERFTVRALILRAVEEQVRDLNARKELTRLEAERRFARQYQTESEIASLRERTGRDAFGAGRKPRRIELAAAQRHALEAFTSQRCLVFVGDRQVHDLDEEVDLRSDSKIQFVRVLPLRGGSSG